MDPYFVNQCLEAWQRCLPNNLPNLFNFYNEKLTLTERVATFELKPEDIQKLASLDVVNIRILMGCLPEDTEFKEVPNKPAFTPILQAILSDEVKGEQKYEHCFELHHVECRSGHHHNTTLVESPNSIGDPGWITSTTAQLFMTAWLECPIYHLGAQFEVVGITSPSASTPRVRFYQYNEKETNDILTIIRKPGQESIQVLMNMGLSLPVLNHPFGFRPIIEVKSIPTKKANEGNEEDDEYFEFSNPCPPACG